MIQNNDTDWLRKLGERVDSIEDVPAEGAFEAIMASAAGARRRARARRTVALVAGLAAAAAVSALFLLPEGAVDAPQNEGCLMAESAAVETLEPIEAVAAAEADGPVASKSLVAAAPSAAESRPDTDVCSATPAATSGQTATVKTAEPAASLPAEPQPAASSVTSQPESRPTPQSTPQTHQHDNAASLERYIASLDDETPRSRRFSIAVNSGSASFKGGSCDYLDTYYFPNAISSDDSHPVAQVRSGFGDDIPASSASSSIVSVHRQTSVPVIAGISLSYDIFPRLAIESGICYSKLTAEVSAIGKTKQTCYHHIGIPLAIKAGICSMGRSEFYAKAGGMVERCVGVSQNVVFKPERFLWSASGYAGYQYRLADFCGFYLEPGFSYHFDNGDEGGIYNESPYMFTLQTGLRFIL